MTKPAYFFRLILLRLILLGLPMVCAMPLLTACPDGTTGDADGDGDAGSPVADGGDNGDGDAGTPLTCEELDLAFFALAQEVVQSYTACPGCTDVSSCVLVSATLTCPEGATVDLCELGVAAGQADAFLADLSAQGLSLCAGVDGNCRAGGTCAPVVAELSDEVCGVAPDPSAP